MPKIEQKIIKGGVKLIFVQDKKFKRSSALLSFDIGRHTTSHKEFSALHILEHLILEGNEEYPSPQKELFKNNCEVNGEVNNDTIRFWIAAKEAEFYNNLELLTKLILNPLLSDTKLAQEKRVLTEEMQEGLQSIEVVMGQRVEAALWPSSPYGQLEEAYESIQQVTLEDLKHIHEAIIADSKTVIILAGGFDKERAQKILEESWGSIKASTKIKQSRSELAPNLPVFSVLPVNFDQAGCQIVYGYEKEPNDKRTVALGLLNAYFSHPGLGLLSTELREKRKLVYSIQSGLELSKQKGLFAIDTRFNHQKTKEVTSTLFETINELKKSGPRKEELEHIKTSYLAALHEDAEEPEFWCYFLESSGMMDLDVVKDFDNFHRQILKLDGSDLLREARSIFQEKNLTIVMAGPYEPKAVGEIKTYLEEIIGKELRLDSETEKYVTRWSVAGRIKSLFTKKR